MVERVEGAVARDLELEELVEALVVDLERQDVADLRPEERDVDAIVVSSVNSSLRIIESGGERKAAYSSFHWEDFPLPCRKKRASASETGYGLVNGAKQKAATHEAWRLIVKCGCSLDWTTDYC